MDSHDSYRPLFTTRTRVSNAGAMLCQLAQYALCLALGLLGGALGVALAVGLAILIQLRLPPPVAFTPGMVPLMVMAALVGLAVSWLLGQWANHSWPDLATSSRLNGLQVILVASVFTSLAQSLLFFA